MTLGGGGRGGTRQCGRDAWRRGAVRVAGRGTVPAEAVAGRAAQGRARGGKGFRRVGRLLGRSLGPARDEQRCFVIIRKYPNGLN
jgi:hypothetical protein